MYTFDVSEAVKQHMNPLIDQALKISEDHKIPLIIVAVPFETEEGIQTSVNVSLPKGTNGAIVTLYRALKSKNFLTIMDMVAVLLEVDQLAEEMDEVLKDGPHGHA